MVVLSVVHDQGHLVSLFQLLGTLIEMVFHKQKIRLSLCPLLI